MRKSPLFHDEQTEETEETEATEDTKDTTDEDTDDTEDTDETEDTTDGETEATVIDASVFCVSVVGEGTLTVTPYALTEEASDYEITDAAAVELSKFEATEQSEAYAIDTAWAIRIAEDGVLTESASDQIAAGDMLVVYTDADGVTNIVIYRADEQDTTDTDTDSAEDTEDDTADQEQTDETTDAKEV